LRAKGFEPGHIPARKAMLPGRFHDPVDVNTLDRRDNTAGSRPRMSRPKVVLFIFLHLSLPNTPLVASRHRSERRESGRLSA